MCSHFYTNMYPYYLVEIVFVFLNEPSVVLMDVIVFIND